MRTNTYTLLFTALLTALLGLLLSLAQATLKPRQERNVEVDRKRNILRALDFAEERPWSADQIQVLFEEAVVGLLMDSAGKRVPDLRPRDLDPSSQPDLLPLYLKVVEGRIDGYALPISGKGLWSTLYGYLALQPDGSTVKGIKFYQHGETPGLGGEVEKDWFSDNFVGKRIINAAGELVGIQLVKGKVDPANPEAYHRVDGISGATMTARGVNAFLMSDLERYEPVLIRIREEGGLKWDS